MLFVRSKRVPSRSRLNHKRNIGKLKMVYDLCVIGCGPAGFSGATRAWDFGKNVCVIEADRVGGMSMLCCVLVTFGCSIRGAIFIYRDTKRCFG